MTKGTMYRANKVPTSLIQASVRSSYFRFILHVLSYLLNAMVPLSWKSWLVLFLPDRLLCFVHQEWRVPTSQVRMLSTGPTLAAMHLR